MSDMIADVTFSTEGIVIIGGLMAALTVVIGILWKRGESDKAAMLKEKDNQIASWEQMAKQGTTNLQKAAEIYGPKATGIAPALPLAPVVPEHSSPVTPSQMKTADMATVRSQLTAATLALGLDARPYSDEIKPDDFQAGRKD